MSKQLKKQKVLVALSGGVDSAVSLYLLLKAGYTVEAVYMKNWSSTLGLKYSDCPWLSDRRDAARVAAHFGVKLHTLNFEQAYTKKVLDHFFAEYKKGRTPNPDIECNREIKFKLLYAWARHHKFDFLATGHYAQIALPKATSRLGYRLLQSKDPFKDQTYFIHSMPYEDLAHILFPIGHLEKKQVKALAEKIKLPNAKKKESMGVCFVGKIVLKDFLGQRIQKAPGDVVDFDTQKKVGTHDGIHQFTIGQRQGVDVASEKPYYVVQKDLNSHILYVTHNPDHPAFYSSRVILENCNWLVSLSELESQIFGQHRTARFRHQGELVPCVLQALPRKKVQLDFMLPQKALVPGQSVVVYHGSVCLGGGIIA